MDSNFKILTVDHCRSLDNFKTNWIFQSEHGMFPVITKVWMVPTGQPLITSSDAGKV